MLGMMNEESSESHMKMLKNKKEFSWELLLEEYKEYVKLSSEDGVKKVVEQCAEHFFELEATSFFLKEVLPDLWLKVLELLMVEDESTKVCIGTLGCVKCANF